MNNNGFTITIGGNIAGGPVPKGALASRAKFSIGDRVKTNSRTFCGAQMPLGSEGTVVQIRPNTDVGIEFDNFTNGHDCDGRAQRPRGYYGPVSELDLVSTSTAKSAVKSKKPKFKLNDNVVVIKNTCGHGYAIGGTFTIGRIDDNLGRVWDDGDQDSYVNFADIKLAKKRSTKMNLKYLDALVIEDSVKEEIKAVAEQHKYSHKLFHKWGLGKTIEYGKGMTFLFWGEPGTGKTWGAHCIAKALGKEIMTIGAAEIQSSEPGASNRNIQDAFKEATKSGKLLLIDECDSLIFDRSQLGMVLASEVNTLLTEIEKFEGVIVLATNRISDMDTALERRISLIVEFPHPTKEQRKVIWQNLIPKKLPLHEDVILDELSEHKLTGGLIKNVVLQASRLALAAKKEQVDKSHFTQAIERVIKSQNLMGNKRQLRPGLNMQPSAEHIKKVNNFFTTYERKTDI